MSKLTVPELSLVVLVGPSGAGKTTFAKRHFKATEVLSSDVFRGLVCDDERDQSSTKDAFDALRFVAGKRLAAGRLTVIDATNVVRESRRPFVELARAHHVLPVAIVLNLPEAVCNARNEERPDRDFGRHVLRRQIMELRRSVRRLGKEGFRYVHVLSSEEEINGAVIERTRLWCNLTDEHGPFDIIGDVHGCDDELGQLLGKLGYDPTTGCHSQGRKVVFLGDLVDRGPNVPGVLRRVMQMVKSGNALCVPGNHDSKLLRKLRGSDVQITHGLAESLAQLAREPESFRQDVIAFIDDLVSHYVLDGGKLVVAHAGMKEAYQGRGSAAVRDFALYGETTGEIDAFGLPVRCDWAESYRGRATVVYGHTPVPTPEWINGTINIDTGCVFGGQLTALRYPERELVSVKALATWCEPVKPFLAAEACSLGLTDRSGQHVADDELDLEDVVGKRAISTRLGRNVTINEENAIAGLEVMSRFSADPRWLIYLPPTMSPCETAGMPGLLEHPSQVFAHFRQAGVSTVVCQEKHMGSRAVVVVCRSPEVAQRRFGIATSAGTGEREQGICYTRTGRRFFSDGEMEKKLIALVAAAVERAGLWDALKSDWLCLDCELMPWSAKAMELISHQYAAVGAAAEAALSSAVRALEAAGARGPLASNTELLAQVKMRKELSQKYAAAYSRYYWPVGGIEDLRLAPFHLLASEGRVHTDKSHLWHMDMAERLANAGGPVLMKTNFRMVDLTEPVSESEAVGWWQALTEAGGEGMVVKPLDFVTKDRAGRGLVQPAIKCRGLEYLRIIYGPEYTLHLDRLASRGLRGKRSLALREFALGIEALERFVRREPLRRVHECTFGVLALESEPVDPRL